MFNRRYRVASGVGITMCMGIFSVFHHMTAILAPRFTGVLPDFVVYAKKRSMDI